jgi:ribosomal protein L11 methyltransferase
MAFGTGSHATTRGCLEFIERVANRLRKAQWIGLDVGTGSGILSIAMVQIGAARVWAIDNDPVALEVARENLVKNAVAKSVRLSAMRLNRVRKTFPVVVANLTAETIVELSAALGARVAKHGALILSGILNSKADRVIACMTADGFTLLGRKRERQWTSLLLRRK